MPLAATPLLQRASRSPCWLRLLVQELQRRVEGHSATATATTAATMDISMGAMAVLAVVGIKDMLPTCLTTTMLW